MYKFNPEYIVCRGLSKPVVQDCLAVLGDMPATEGYTVFGKKGAPNVEVDLPHTIVAYDPRKSCV